MGKKIGAVVAGVIVAFTIVALVEAIGHYIYPVPTDIDMADKEAFKAFVATLPIDALLFVMLAWVLRAIGGSVVAGKIVGPPTMLYTEIVTGVVLLASIMQLVMIPHPMWFSITAVIALIGSVWVSEDIQRRLSS